METHTKPATKVIPIYLLFVVGNYEVEVEVEKRHIVHDCQEIRYRNAIEEEICKGISIFIFSAKDRER